MNEDDHQIGVMDKIEAHRGDGKLHRACSVFLFNDKGRLLIQQRSNTKIVGAEQWANSCCGNVRPGESYIECALRRLQEELGITEVELTRVTKFLYQVKCNEAFSEYEMDTVFIGLYDGMVSPNRDEVRAVNWINFDDLLTQESVAPWVFEMNKQHVLDAVRKEYENTRSER